MDTVLFQRQLISVWLARHLSRQETWRARGVSMTSTPWWFLSSAGDLPSWRHGIKCRLLMKSTANEEQVLWGMTWQLRVASKGWPRCNMKRWFFFSLEVLGHSLFYTYLVAWLHREQKSFRACIFLTVWLSSWREDPSITSFKYYKGRDKTKLCKTEDD